MARCRLPPVPGSEITGEAVYRDRRRLLKAFALAPALTVAGCRGEPPPPVDVPRAVAGHAACRKAESRQSLLHLRQPRRIDVERINGRPDVTARVGVTRFGENDQTAMTFSFVGSSGASEVSYAEESGYKTYQTRIGSTANKVNLAFEEALPELKKGLITSISGLF